MIIKNLICYGMRGVKLGLPMAWNAFYGERGVKFLMAIAWNVYDGIPICSKCSALPTDQLNQISE